MRALSYRRRRQPQGSPLMLLHPYVRYLLWRGLSPVVIGVASIVRILRAFDWRLFGREMVGLATLAGLVLVIILWVVGLMPPMVS